MLHRLPESEISYLASLSPEQQRWRMRDLHLKAGWSLSAIGQSLPQPRPKTTIHYWVTNADPAHAPAPDADPPMPIPTATAVLPIPAPTRIRTISPRVPPDLRPRLAHLGSLARRYRAKTPASSPAAIANRELNELAARLRDSGVPTADIAEAAGISYRAMARRLAQRSYP